MIRDLLQPASGYLDVREDSKGGIQVAGLTEIGTTSSQDVSPVWPAWLWLNDPVRDVRL